MNTTESAQPPSAEVRPATNAPVAEQKPPASDSSTALLVGPSMFAGSFVSTTPGLVVALQYRSSSSHAFLVGARGGVHFPGKYTGTSVFGTAGVDLGYRGNFLSPGTTEAGLLVFATPSAAIGVGKQSAFILPVSIGGFVRFGAVEFQLTGAAGPGVGNDGIGPLACFSLLGGGAFN